MEKTSVQLAAEQLLSEGGRRVDAPAVVTLSTGTRIEVVKGWAAVRESRVFCVGQMRVIQEVPAP